MSKSKVDFDRLKEDSVLLKSAILCYGLKENLYSEELRDKFNPFFVRRTGNVGIHFEITSGLVVNAGFFSHIADEDVPSIELKKIERDCWGIYVNGVFLKVVSLIDTPSWYMKKTFSAVPMGEVFLLEGYRNLMGSLGDPCCFFRKSEQCKFCGYLGGKNGLTTQDFSEVVCEAFFENSDITVTLTNGNSYSADRGCHKYIPYVNQIVSDISKKFPNRTVPIQIECSPPENFEYLYDLIKAGVSSFSINYECFSSDVRKSVMPGKGSIPVLQYEMAWKYVISKLGRGRVSSAILFGLDSYQDMLDGLLWLADLGVRPNVIPFRPMKGAAFQFRKGPDYIEYYNVCKRLSKILKDACLDTIGNLGCSSCGGCNIEGDFNKLNVKRERR